MENIYKIVIYFRNYFAKLFFTNILLKYCKYSIQISYNINLYNKMFYPTKNSLLSIIKKTMK